MVSARSVRYVARSAVRLIPLRTFSIVFRGTSPTSLNLPSIHFFMARSSAKSSLDRPKPCVLPTTPHGRLSYSEVDRILNVERIRSRNGRPKFSLVFGTQVPSFRKKCHLQWKRVKRSDADLTAVSVRFIRRTDSLKFQ